jgi:hypothetical protein
MQIPSPILAAARDLRPPHRRPPWRPVITRQLPSPPREMALQELDKPPSRATTCDDGVPESSNCSARVNGAAGAVPPGRTPGQQLRRITPCVRPLRGGSIASILVPARARSRSSAARFPPRARPIWAVLTDRSKFHDRRRQSRQHLCASSDGAVRPDRTRPPTPALYPRVRSSRITARPALQTPRRSSSWSIEIPRASYWAPARGRRGKALREKLGQWRSPSISALDAGRPDHGLGPCPRPS